MKKSLKNITLKSLVIKSYGSYGWYILSTRDRRDLYMHKDGNFYDSTGKNKEGYWPSKEEASEFLKNRFKKLNIRKIILV